ncbi:hypothetical protein HDU76_010609 [Blyttiomyces sp. JEL0837]|nr:hypothetical protein HDU76_010609 [Blyttiomyces sp. JEL0837]
MQAATRPIPIPVLASAATQHWPYITSSSAPTSSSAAEVADGRGAGSTEQGAGSPPQLQSHNQQQQSVFKQKYPVGAQNALKAVATRRFRSWHHPQPLPDKRSRGFQHHRGQSASYSMPLASASTRIGDHQTQSFPRSSNSTSTSAAMQIPVLSRSHQTSDQQSQSSNAQTGPAVNLPQDLQPGVVRPPQFAAGSSISSQQRVRGEEDKPAAGSASQTSHPPTVDPLLADLEADLMAEGIFENDFDILDLEEDVAWEKVAPVTLDTWEFVTVPDDKDD